MIFTDFNTINKKYNIIYADPPWQYKDNKSNDPKLGGITYPTMSIEELCKLPVSNIADINCVLFMWVTMPLLPSTFEVIDAWGFNYKTCAFCWVKTTKSNKAIYSGLGNYVNGNAELCLLAKKGKLDRINKNVKQVLIEPLGVHSAKPKRVYNDIENLYGDLPRIELFSRCEHEGWDSFGNEVEPIKKGLF